MDGFNAAKSEAPALIVMTRELSLAADHSMWAGEQAECITIIAQIYKLFDDLIVGPEVSLCGFVSDRMSRC